MGAHSRGDAAAQDIGTQLIVSEPWCLQRVTEYRSFGELEDYDELEQLQEVSAALENSESDYTSSTSDEEDFETTRMKQIEELRKFSDKLRVEANDAALTAAS